MAMTWGTIIAGVLVVFGLPILVVTLNKWKKPVGWIVLAAIVAFMVIGNIIESALA